MTNSSLPGDPCKTPPRSEWTEPEKWVWKQVCEGKIADFNALYQKADPGKLADWTDERVISPNFLETILLNDPYKSVLPHEGVRIVGAWLKEELDLSNARLAHAFWLDGSRVEKKIILRFLKSTEYLSFEDSLFAEDLVLAVADVDRHVNMSGVKVRGELDLNGLSIGGSLFIPGSSELQEVNLRSARIHGWLDMTGVTVHGKLDTNGVFVGGNLLLGDGADLQEVDLAGARVDGQLVMTDCSMQGTLTMNGLSVGEHLYLDGNVGKFGNVDLAVAKVNGQISMEKAAFSGEISMDSITIGQHLKLDSAIFEKKISLMFATIGGTVNLSGATLFEVDLSAASIKGELALGEAPDKSPKWREGSCLILRNTEIGSLRDAGEGNKVWPAELKLAGFTYKRLGAISVDRPGDSSLFNRDAAWFVAWLKKDKSFSTQPYQQLAGVLQSMGNSGKAASVLYAAKQRERSEAFLAVDNCKWFGLCVLDWTIGYGFGYRYFRSLLWVAAFTIIGAFVLLTINGETANLGLPERIAYSVNLLLPIVKLNERYKITACFSGWQLYYFYIHEVIGYLLGSFVVAGLAGITKK